MGYGKSSSKREVYINKILPRKQEKLEINNLTAHLKQLGKEEETKPKISKMKGSIKIRAEINEIEMKKTITKIKETES